MLRMEKFWAKTNPFQSVVVHGYITGVIAQSIYSDVLCNGVREQLQRLLGMNMQQVRVFIGYLASLHDVGKIEGRFQVKEAGMAQLLQEEALYSKGIFTDPVRHEKTSREILSEIWKLHLSTSFERKYLSPSYSCGV